MNPIFAAALEIQEFCSRRGWRGLGVSGLLAILLAAPSAYPQTTGASGPKEMLLDLATLGPGEHRLVVPAERRIPVRLVNRVYGAWYRRSSPGAFTLDRPNEPWRPTPSLGCETAFALHRELEAAMDEAASAAALVRLEAELGKPGCTDQSLAYNTQRESRLPEGVGPLDGGDIREVRVERLAAENGPPTQTWVFRFEAVLPPNEWRHANEETWLLDSIGRDLGEMLLFAAGRRVPPSALTARVTRAASGDMAELSLGWGKGAELYAAVDVSGSVWSPVAYEGLVRALLLKLKIGAAQRAAEGDPLPEALLDPLATVLVTEDDRLSRRLAANMLDPAAHEAAALLLAAFALREEAGDFSDLRPALCRLTAHLALARGLRKDTPPGRAGEFAHIALQALIGRQAEALASLDAITPRSPAERSWVNAIRLRITTDWRLLKEPVLASLFERREHYRALALSLTGLHALEFLGRRNSEPVPDWGRIALATRPSVEEGNVFARAVVAGELQEIAAVLGQIDGRERGEADLAAALNEPPQRCVTTGGPQVLGRGAFAAFAARHTAQAMWAIDHHLRSMQGFPEEADQAFQALRQRLAGLDLAPLVTAHVTGLKKKRGEGAPDLKSVCRDASPFWERFPERLTAANWGLLRSLCERQEAEPTSGVRWFGRGLLSGTAFDVGARAHLLGFDSGNRRAMAPFDRALLERDLRNAAIQKVMDSGFPRVLDRAALFQPTPTQVREVYGPLADYDLAVMKQLARAEEDGPPRRVLLGRVCDADGNSCVLLGDYLAGQDEEDEAAAAYQRAMDEGLDRVASSNHMGWLADFYLRRGRPEEAKAVGRRAAEAGSYAGLVTLGEVQERLGQSEEAERTLRQAADRYGESAALWTFYVRQDRRLGGERYKAQAGNAMARLFRLPLTRTSLAELTSAPSERESVLVVRSSPHFEKLGLRTGDVIVAVDGYRVRTRTDLVRARALSVEPAATLIVWREGRYLEVAGPRSPHPGLTLRSLGEDSPLGG